MLQRNGTPKHTWRTRGLPFKSITLAECLKIHLVWWFPWQLVCPEFGDWWKGWGRGLEKTRANWACMATNPRVLWCYGAAHTTHHWLFTVRSLWSWHRFTSVLSLRRRIPVESFYASWKGIKITTAAPHSHRGPFLHCTKAVTIFGTLLVQTLTTLSRMGEEGPAFTPLAVTGLEFTVRCP